MSFPRYERYKDSNYGNGELPITWSEVRLKTILAQKITDGPHETPDFTEFGIPFLSVDGIQNSELVFAGCRYISEEAHWLYRKKVQPRRDDILLAKAASTGKIARVKTDIEFNIWSPLAVIRLDTSRSIPAFVEYVLQSPESQAQVEMLCTANTQKNISMDDIPLIAFALPPRDIQSAIVTFLQRETAKIDALIEEQRRLIELLKEKRQAVISHAVTKGLNPNASLKESGIDWLAKVPAHWSVAAVSYRYEVQLGKMLDTLKITGDHLRHYLRVFDVQWGEINTDELPCMDFDDEARAKFRLRAGDLLVNEGGSYPGRCAIWTSNMECYYQKALHRLRPHNPEIDTGRFMFYVMLWASTIGVFIAGGNEATIEHLPAEKLRRHRFAFPPSNEQTEIADFLDAEFLRFGDLMAHSQNAIELLQERRSALISAAVTGKIDVRNYTPKEAA